MFRQSADCEKKGKNRVWNRSWIERKKSDKYSWQQLQLKTSIYTTLQNNTRKCKIQKQQDVILSYILQKLLGLENIFIETTLSSKVGQF